MSQGLTTPGLAALDAMLARHVEQAEVPGLVALVARGDDVHVAALGHKALGDSDPIGRDAIFRIASLTKPIAGAAAMPLHDVLRPQRRRAAGPGPARRLVLVAAEAARCRRRAGVDGG